MIIYFAFLWALLKQFEKYFTKKSISAIALFLIFPLAIILQCNACGEGKLWWMNHDLWFYSYNMNPIFPILLFAQWEKYYVTGQTEFSTKEKIYNGILIFLTATGHEFFRIILLCSIPLIFILNNKLNIEKLSAKKFGILYSVLIVLNTALCFNGDFQDWLGSKLRSGGECFSIILPYMKEYTRSVLSDNLFLFIFIIITAVSVLYIGKNSKECKKLLTVNFSLILSVLFFNIIIISGVEDYEFAFNHPGVRFLTKIMLLYSVLSFSGYALGMIKEFKHKLFFGFSLAIIILSYCLPQRELLLTESQGLDNKEFKQKIYISEKLFHLFGEEEKQAYLPDTGTLPDFVLTEFLYNTGKRGNLIEKTGKYKIVRTENSIESLNKIYEEKTGEKITAEELEECNFTKMRKDIQNNK